MRGEKPDCHFAINALASCVFTLTNTARALGELFGKSMLDMKENQGGPHVGSSTVTMRMTRS